MREYVNGTSDKGGFHSTGSPALDNQILVTTPENIAFNYQVAGPFRRVMAFGLDLLVAQVGYGLLVVLISILFSLVFFPLTAASPGARALVEALAGILQGLIIAGFFVATWFYGAIMETYCNGQSLGKMLVNLRVLSTDGSAIDGGQATLRNFFRLLDSAPPISFGLVFGVDGALFPLPTFLVGLTVMTISRKYQRIGDLVARTMVVTEDKKWATGLAKLEDERVEQLAELIPADYEVSASMARALAEYVDRRRYLPYPRVAEIANHLGVPLVARFQLPTDTNHDLLLCSLYFKAFMSDREANDRHDGQSLTPNPVAGPPTATISSPTEDSLSHESR